MVDHVLKVDNLSKRYTIGHRSDPLKQFSSQWDATNLRWVIKQGVKSLVRKTAGLIRGMPVGRENNTEPFWGLSNVSFEVARGEILGVIGRNGAGKSTLLKILSRITEPTSGRVVLQGRLASLLEVGTGFHPELTGRENVFLNGAILGMARAEIRRKFDEVVDFAGVSKFIDTPVKRYSSGMYVRLAFAVAAHLEPDILIVDEVLAVGDAEFQRKCLGKIQDVGSSGRTVLVVSHNMTAIQNLCSRCILLSHGKLVFDGEPATAISKYSSSLREARAEDKSFGHGSHTAIKSVNLLDSNGAPTNHYVPGEALRMEIVVWTDGGAGVSVDIFLASGQGASLAVGALSAFHGVTLPNTAGIYKTILEFEPIWLATGEYVVNAATSISQAAFDHYVESAVTFDVLSCNPGNQSWDFKLSYGFGAIAMRHLSPMPTFTRSG